MSEAMFSLKIFNFMANPQRTDTRKQEEPDILYTSRLGWLTPIRAVRALRVIASANYASQKLFALRTKTFVFGHEKKERRKLLSKLAPH